MNEFDVQNAIHYLRENPPGSEGFSNIVGMMQMSIVYYSMPDLRPSLQAVFADDLEALAQFRQCMAVARLQWDREYRKAVQDTLCETLYNELRRK